MNQGVKESTVISFISSTNMTTESFAGSPGMPRLPLVKMVLANDKLLLLYIMLQHFFQFVTGFIKKKKKKLQNN